MEKKQQLGKKIENMTSDCGWGCTIRSTQMLIANVIRIAYKTMDASDILKLFDDNERGKNESAFSIQNVAVEGLEFGKLPGNWYGVNTITNVFEVLNEKYRPLPDFKVCVFQDSCII